MQAVCVFCGSATGNDPQFAKAARHVGRTLGEARIRLVYGGGHIGLMGTVADAALEAGGEVIGVIPQSLYDWEIAHQGLTELRVVESMHARKTIMAELSDAFIALPGGIGTLEELIEQWTWNQLGFHTKPCGVLSVAGYYAPLGNLISTMVESGFVQAEFSKSLSIEQDIGVLLGRLGEARAQQPKWEKPL